MSTKKKVIKSIQIFFWSFSQIISLLISGVVLYMIYAFLGMSISYRQNQSFVGPKQKIYVRSNGVHTDICVEIQNRYYDWWTFLDRTDYPDRNFKWMAIGWGDEEFYTQTKTWDDLKVSTTLSSFLLATQGALHVEMLVNEPQENERCAIVEVSPEGYKALTKYIHGSFKLNNSDPEIIEEFTYFGTDRFYRSKQQYHLFENCNSWTNMGLKKAGVSTMAWAVFPQSLINFLKD